MLVRSVVHVICADVVPELSTWTFEIMGATGAGTASTVKLIASVLLVLPAASATESEQLYEPSANVANWSVLFPDTATVDVDARVQFVPLTFIVPASLELKT